MNWTTSEFLKGLGPSRSTLRFASRAALLISMSAVIACGDSGEGDNAGGQGGSGLGGEGASGGEGGGETTNGGGGEGASGGAGGEGGSGGGTPMKPDDCVEVSFTEIELVSQQQNQPDSSDVMPVVRTPSSLANFIGDAKKFDRLRISFDGKTEVGVHAFDSVLNHIVPDYVETYSQTCTACSIFQVDLDESVDPSAYAKSFASKAGELEIIDLLTPHQTSGAIRHVELREIAADVDTGIYDWVDGGACYWIEEAEFDVRRPNGCMPFTNDACPADQFCMPVVSSGIDGECVTGGDVGPGEACTFVNDTTWDSDCELGLRCFNDGSGGICMQTCDIFAASPGCPAQTHCGGGYNMCMPEEILTESGLDPALLGETCEVNPTALYCGGSGQPGMCWDDDQDGPMESICYPLHSAPSECLAPQTAGTLQYKGGIDLSTVWCVTPYDF